MVGTSISANLAKVQGIISQALIASGRQSDIKIIAVTKKQSVSRLQKCIDSGLQDFGENYFNEAIEKIDKILSPGLRWHFIGKVQSNKVKNMLGHFYMWHGVDSFKVLQEIEKRNLKGPRQKILLQVNVSGEDSKSGMSPENLQHLLPEIKGWKAFEICGLMTMPPFSDSDEESRRYFRELRELLEKCRDLVDPQMHSMTELSMGTSQDFRVAVEEGATYLRLGEVLVGPREIK